MKEYWSPVLKKIKLVCDQHEFSRVLQDLGPESRDRPVRVGFVNAHALNLCIEDSNFRQNLASCEFLFRDGIGIKILYKLLGSDPGMNLNGTDFIPQIIKLYSGCDVALIGTEEPFLTRSVTAIREKGVKPIYVSDGFQDDYTYLEGLQKQKPSLIILAMGMPKQERIANILVNNLNYPCLIICGGAILDFLGGKVARAPAIFQRFGMEWFYRLVQEPKRLYRRYVIGNFVFLFRSFLLTLPPNRPNIKSF